MKKRIILLLHLGYWSFYLLLLLVIFIAAQVGHSSGGRISYFVGVGFTFIFLPAILGFYTAYVLLFNYYLRWRNLGLLLSFGLLVGILAAGISGGLISIVFGGGFMFKNGYESFWSELLLISAVGWINGVVGFILKGFISWYKDLKIKEKLQQQTEVMELALIKSKLDPHFLFNTINNIDELLVKDVDRASDYLNRLSTILRFMLYESKSTHIPLAKELDYVHKYIELQKIRTSNPDFVSYTLSGKVERKQIPPMLFIPFIENAFKHVASKKAYHAIEIHVEIEKESIIFQCKNNRKDKIDHELQEEGIGNELIEKRLQLLYRDRYTLERIETKDMYSIQLTISTNED